MNVKKKGTILGVVIFLILAGIYYYLALPAFNLDYSRRCRESG